MHVLKSKNTDAKKSGAGKKLKDKEALTVRKKGPSTGGDIFVLVADRDKEDDNLGPHIVKGKRLSQTVADAASGFLKHGRRTSGSGRGPGGTG